MSSMRYAARRDSTELDVVAALRDAGALVRQLDARDLPDLLVGFQGRWTLLEVKRPPGPRGGTSADGQKLSDGQAEFFARCVVLGLPVRVVHNRREALEAIGAKEV